MEDLLSNPLLILALGYILARWDKRGEQQTGSAVSLAALQASIEEKFKTVFSRLESLDESRSKHDTRISDLVTQVHELVARIDMLLGLGRADAAVRRRAGVQT